MDFNQPIYDHLIQECQYRCTNYLLNKLGSKFQVQLCLFTVVHDMNMEWEIIKVQRNALITSTWYILIYSQTGSIVVKEYERMSQL